MRPLDAEEMGVRAVYRLITNSMRLLTSPNSTIAQWGAPGPRAIGKEPRLHILDILWPLSFLPRMSLYTLLGIPRYPSLTAPAHSRSVPLTY